MGEPSQFREPSRNAPTQLSPDQANRLWEEFRAGHNPAGRAALDGLYRSLRKPLVEFCMLKGCDPELADEIAETAFVRLIIRRPVARRGFISLLRKTAQNLCRDAQKSRRRSPTPLPHPGDAPQDRAATVRERPATRAPTVRERPSPQSHAPSASERVSRDETIQAVQDCLAQLPPEHRAFIVYHEVEGLTQQAACDLLGWKIAPSTAHARLARIREQLARCLEKKKIF